MVEEGTREEGRRTKVEGRVLVVVMVVQMRMRMMVGMVAVEEREAHTRLTERNETKKGKGRRDAASVRTCGERRLAGLPRARGEEA